MVKQGDFFGVAIAAYQCSNTTDALNGERDLDAGLSANVAKAFVAMLVLRILKGRKTNPNKRHARAIPLAHYSIRLRSTQLNRRVRFIATWLSCGKVKVLFSGRILTVQTEQQLGLSPW